MAAYQVLIKVAVRRRSYITVQLVGPPSLTCVTCRPLWCITWNWCFNG